MIIQLWIFLTVAMVVMGGLYGKTQNPTYLYGVIILGVLCVCQFGLWIIEINLFGE